MSYHLSEAYSDLYNPRVESFDDDNLRFIDTMQDEDIQEVVESIYWEFRDYGMTEDVAFDTIFECVSEEVINEAYDVINGALINEATVTYGRGSTPITRGNKRQRSSNAGAGAQRVTMGRGSDTDLRRSARAARLKSAANIVKNKNRVDGPISRVRAAISGAQMGPGQNQKSVASRMGQLSSAVSDGKAKLTRLFRTGATLVGQKFNKAKEMGRAVKAELSGENARQARLRYDTRKNIRAAKAKAAIAAPTPKPVAPTPKPPTQAPSPTYTREPSGQLNLFAGTQKGKLTPAKPKVPPKPYGAKKRPSRATGVIQRKITGLKLEQLNRAILDDLIQHGYAYDLNEAIEILESMEQSTFDELIEAYLED